jgi:hypothetical protein
VYFSICIAFCSLIGMINLQVKKFDVLSAKNRTQLRSKSGARFLRDCVTVVVGIISMQVAKSPLKDLSVSAAFLDADAAAAGHDDADAADAGAAAPMDVDAVAIHHPFVREYIDGFPIGNIRHDVELDDDGDAIGVGPESPSDHIDFGMRVGDFRVGQRVWAWWWGFLWPATVHRINLRADTLTLRWHHFRSFTAGYDPRLARMM